METKTERRELTKEEATEFFGELFYGKHHIPDKVREYGYGWCVKVLGDFATFDYNMLTRFVVMCHDKCYRGSVRAWTFKEFRLTIWRRDREGDISHRHPTIEDAVKQIREGYGNK